jgi:hypothetical protein
MFHLNAIVVSQHPVAAYLPEMHLVEDDLRGVADAPESSYKREDSNNGYGDSVVPFGAMVGG